MAAKKGAVPPVAAELDPTEQLDEYLRKCVRIDPLDIQTEFIRIPGDLAYWNDRYAEALREHLTSKTDLEVLKAQLQPLVRQALLDAGGKVTEAQVAAAIETHDEVIEAKHRCITAEVEKNRLFGSLDAIRSKKEMLVSLGAHLRAEMGGDPALRDQVRASRLRDEG
jgi:hypothetical protein